MRARFRRRGPTPQGSLGADRSRSATGSSSPTPRGGCTPSPSRPGASSTPTAGGSPTTTSSGARRLGGRATPRDRVPRAAAAAGRLRACRCRAAPPSSTPRTPARSSRWPTSSPAPGSSRPGSGPAPCRCRCCGPSASTVGCTRSSAARTSPTSPAATPGPSSASTTRPGGSPSATSSRPARRREPGTVDRVVLDMLAPWECLDAVAEALRRPAACSSATSRRRPSCPGSPRGCADHGGYTEPEAWESLVRGWHLEGLAVRPAAPDARSHRLPRHDPPAGARGHPAAARAPPRQGRPRRGRHAVDVEARPESGRRRDSARRPIGQEGPARSPCL